MIAVFWISVTPNAGFSLSALFTKRVSAGLFRDIQCLSRYRKFVALVSYPAYVRVGYFRFYGGSVTYFQFDACRGTELECRGA